MTQDVPGFILRLVVLLSLSLCAQGCGTKHPAGPSTDQKTHASQTIPLTMANIKGHRMLYDEGWFVVSSSRKAFEFAKEKSLRASRESMRLIAKDVTNHSRGLKSHVAGDAKKTYGQAARILSTGTHMSGAILDGSLTLSANEIAYSGDTAQKALSRFVRGNLSIFKRGAEDLRDMKNLPGRYYTQLKDDFSNLADLNDTVIRKVSESIDLSWEKSFEKAAESFRSEYEQSGTRPNTLSALGDILAGYLKAAYHGLAEPGAKSLVEYTVKGTGNIVFLPAAAVTVASGRSVEATGLSLFYVSRTGYHVIAPTVEAGFLSGLALLSAAAAPATLAGGAGLTAVNQVAFTTAAPAYLAGKTATDTVVNSGKYVALVTADVSKGSSRVMINHASSAVVLGYNALTAVPVHLFLGTLDSAVFLGWDGPRLVVAMARGEVSFDSKDQAVSMGDLPAGTVVDLNALKQMKSVEVEVLTDDPGIVGQVLERLPEDVRDNNE